MALEIKPPLPAEDAINEMAKFLDGNGGDRPLALVSDSYDRQEVAKHLGDKRLGTSLVISGSLLAAADYEQDISLAALTYINDHYLLAKNVASMRLLVQIYSALRNQQGKLKFSFASASLFRDVVLEIEQTGKGLPERSDIDIGVYQAELCFVRHIWETCMEKRHSDRAERLKKYADKLKSSNTPVAYLHWGEPDEQIMVFLHYAANQGVPACVLEAELSGRAKELENCWSKGGKPPEGGQLLAYEAQTLEEAALALRKMLLQWLHKHKKDDDIIGIIDYDRALIRRLNSLLMQEDIFLQETTGWPANNLLVGKALLALASGAPKLELISKLQNIIVRKQGNKWTRLPRDLARGKADPDLQQEIVGLKSILKTFTEKEDSHFKSKRSISKWFDKIAEEAETGFFKEFFEQDSAAQDLRRLLRMLADEFAGLDPEEEDEDFSVGEVRRLLFDSLSSIDLNSSNNDSRVQLVPPGRFTTREFKAMLLVGADADTLPSSRAPQLFSNDVREKLHLPTLEKQIERRRKSTALLLGNSSKIDIGAVWHGQAGISPYIDLMSEETKLLRRLRHPWKEKKPKEKPESKAKSQEPLGEESDSKEEFVHKVKLQEPPEKISVSACVELLKCPYKYHAGYVLRLGKDSPASIGQRNKYGTFVHEILEEFHTQLHDGLNLDDAKKQLRIILNEARGGSNSNKSKSSDMTAAERRYFAWEFEHYLEAYVAEIKKLFCEGGKIDKAEVSLEGELCVGENIKIKITGKADRIDCYGESYAVIDVKTGKPDNYKDYTTYPQLPLYMKLYESQEKIDATHTKFWVLSLEKGENNVSIVPGESMPADAPQDVFKHYKKIFDEALGSKKKLLPANGVQSVCQYCEYGGLCRKKHWDTNNNKKKK